MVEVSKCKFIFKPPKKRPFLVICQPRVLFEDQTVYVFLSAAVYGEQHTIYEIALNQIGKMLWLIS